MKKIQYIPLFLSLISYCFSDFSFAASSEVVLTASDGYTIHGSFSRSQQKDANMASVLLHMYKQTKESWDPLVPILNSMGIHTLAIDMRGHGESRKSPSGKDQEPAVINRDPVLFNNMHKECS